MKTAIWLVVIAIGLFVAYMAYNILPMLAYYRNLFSVRHYREVAQVLENLRSQAELHPFVDGEILAQDEDPRTALTSRNLALAYTITQEDGLFVHHLSVNTPRRGGATVAAGETFVSFFAWRLGVNPADCAAFLGVNAFHLEFTVPEENQRDFMDRSLILPTEIDLDTVRKEVLRIRNQFQFFDARQQIEEDWATSPR